MKKSVCLFFLLLLMLLSPKVTVNGAANGLLLWYSSVVPALFPFMVLSSLIVSGGGLSVLMAPFRFILGPLLGLSDAGCYVLISGLVCGFPMGAKTCADFLLSGQISGQEGRLLMAICNHPSPMFVLGYFYPFFAGKLSLTLLLLAVYGPAVLLAAAARLAEWRKLQVRGTAAQANRAEPLTGAVSKLKTSKEIFTGSQKESILQPAANAVSFDQAILSSVEVLCKIGGCLMLFSIAIEFLRSAAWLPVPLFLFLAGALEMTTGIRELALGLPFPLSAAAAGASLTFGGCSGVFQTIAAIGNAKKAGLSIRQYCVWKLLHAALAARILLCFCRFNP